MKQYDVWDWLKITQQGSGWGADHTGQRGLASRRGLTDDGAHDTGLSASCVPQRFHREPRRCVGSRPLCELTFPAETSLWPLPSQEGGLL